MPNFTNQFHVTMDLAVGSIITDSNGNDQFYLYYVSSDRFEPAE